MQPRGMLNNYSMQDALGSVGLGLLNYSRGDKSNPADSLMLWSLMKGQQPSGSMPFSGTNPAYALPPNPIEPNRIEQNPIDNSVARLQDTGGDSVSRLMRSIGKVESGNKYSVMGPRTRRGDRAYGQYQVMGANIPTWTREVLGREMTPDEFLANPQAQDAVAQAKLAAYLRKYGNIQDAASAWFSGRPMRGNNSRDITGTSVPEYVARVNRYF